LSVLQISEKYNLLSIQFIYHNLLCFLHTDLYVNHKSFIDEPHVHSFTLSQSQTITSVFIGSCIVTFIPEAGTFSKIQSIKISSVVFDKIILVFHQGILTIFQANSFIVNQFAFITLFVDSSFTETVLIIDVLVVLKFSI